MELKLNNKVFEYMGAVYKNSFTHEVTTESIIPDSLPDAQRIIDTEAIVCLSGKEVDTGRVTVTGVVDTSVIYADDEGRIKRTEINIPFTVTSDSGGITVNSKAVATVRLASADTRLLNPRKMLVRCDVLLDVTCYDPRETQLWLPPEDDECPVELLTEEREGLVLTDVTEKTFTITEEYSFPPAKPPVGEILKTKVDFELDEYKGVGNKVILKGTAKAQVLYRPERGGEPASIEFSTVFSQIVELGTQSDGMEFKALLVPTGIYFNSDALFSQEDRKITLEAHVLAQCLAYRKESLSCITDAYSSKYEIAAETASVEIDSAGDAVETVELVRDMIETTRQPGNIVSISAMPGVVYKTLEESGLELKSTVAVNILYMSEDGVLLSASKKLNVSAGLSVSGGADYAVSARVQGEPFAVISTDGIEVKLNVAFKAESYNMMSVNGLSAINVDTENPKDLSELPSLVLKRFTQGDTLWSLAKKYCSVTELIRKANGLDAGSEPELDSMLIIPKKR